MMCSILVIVMALATLTPITTSDDRFRHAPCKILFSEMLFNTDTGFIEIGKYCPVPGRKNSFPKLDGYNLIIIEVGSNINAIAYYNLDGINLRRPIGSDTTSEISSTMETTTIVPIIQVPFDRSILAANPPSDRSITSATVPSDRRPRCVPNPIFNETNSNDKDFRNKRCRRNADSNFEPVYYYSQSTAPHKFDSNRQYFIGLLHYKQSGSKVRNLQRFRAGDVLQASATKKLKTKIKDFIVAGKSSFTTLQPFLNNIGISKPIERLVTLGVSPSTLSVNKCDYSAEMFEHKIYKLANPTPEQHNDCDIVTTVASIISKTNYPFQFVGQSIGTHGQKIVVNVLWALEHVLPEIMLNHKPMDIAVKLINLNENTIRQFRKNYESNSIGTPAKTRNYPKRVMNKFDDISKRNIYDIIASFYKRNVVPKLREIYELFLENVRLRQLNAMSSQNDNDDGDELFKCSLNTFRKVLHELGYKFGNLNKRDAVLFDPRIVAWRGKYLKVIRENDKLPEDKKAKIIYTDETWFDTNSRQKKGWRLKCPQTIKEKKDFTFASNKVSRGPRIIIMHAGGHDGFIPEMMKVYSVSSAEASPDYHENVKGSVYLTWFKTLVETLRGKGPHIIVMDNAPYHSVSNAPRLNSRRQILLDYLVKEKAEGRVLPELTKLRRFELEALVRDIKANEPHFVIDELAKLNGHKIARIPPYNCDLNPIELVWYDVKRLLRDQNTDQNIRNNIVRAQNILLSYTAESWRAHIAHVKDLENSYWNGDSVFESTMMSHPEIEEEALADGGEELDLDSVTLE